MGIFGSNAAHNVQPVLRQAERSNPDSKRQTKDHKKDEKSKQPPRDADSVQLKDGKTLSSKPAEKQRPEKHIDFSA